MKRFSPPRARTLLPAVVFITGAAVLIVEVVAVRLLSPYFGNTLYTFSSVLSVILAALAIGYRQGGRLADRRGTYGLFFAIIAAGGFSILVLLGLGWISLPLLSAAFSLSLGPLVASMLLFSAPAFLLGMLSPFAVKLAALDAPDVGVGGAAGSMFFYSTLGSIAGSLSSGFFLIPFVGVAHTLIATATVLVTMGAAGAIESGDFPKSKMKSWGLGVVLLFFFLVWALLRLPAYADFPGVTLHQEDGRYEQITVLETEYRGKRARILALDRGFSSGIFVDSGALAFEYTPYYKFAHFLEEPMQKALVIGGGTFTVPKALADEFPDASVDVVEVEPALYGLAEKYFGLVPTPRIRNITADGRQFLQGSKERYDFIFGDAYSSLYSLPPHLTTKEYYDLVANHLSEGGIYIENFIGSLSETNPSLIYSSIRTLEEVFPEVSVFAVTVPGSISPQNIMLVGHSRPLPERYPADAFLDDALVAHQVAFDHLPLSRFPIITDDKAPAEYFAAKLLSNIASRDLIFDGDEALARIESQLAFGPRYPGSEGHAATERYITGELEKYDIPVVLDTFTPAGSTQRYTNIIGHFGSSSKRIILGAHYDTKRHADLDPRHPEDALPGANDGASGVAVLLELARILSIHGYGNVGIDFVFFDGEEGTSDIDSHTFLGWQPIGSTHFAENIKTQYPGPKPAYGIVVDMVCDRDLDIYRERNSDMAAPEVIARLMAEGGALFPGKFHDAERGMIEDDHSVLTRAGIPSVLLIDLDYPAYHTTSDTISKCSSESLSAVGVTLQKYLKGL